MRRRVVVTVELVVVLERVRHPDQRIVIVHQISGTALASARIGPVSIARLAFHGVDNCNRYTVWDVIPTLSEGEGPHVEGGPASPTPGSLPFASLRVGMT